jgi:dihydrofolate reductase
VGSAHWPTADQHPDATPVEVEFARVWQKTPKVVFSATLDEVSGNARLVTGGAVLAGAAMRAGPIDEYQVVTHPVLVGGGTPFFSALDSWVNLRLVETRTFPDGVTLSHYESRH